MFLKFANADTLTIERLGHETIVRKQSHRAVFDYQPREGYIYVRSRAISSRTNDNFDSWPADELRQAWGTFIGKPVFVNHNNSDIKRKRGVIIDAALHEDTAPDGTPDTWVEVLMEIDANRFPKLAEAILAGDIERTSMGADVGESECSYCGNVATTPSTYCNHIARCKGQRLSRRNPDGTQEDVLVHEICLAGGQFVTTSDGDVAIENVRPGDMVLTRDGWFPVRDAWQTGVFPTVLVEFSDGRTLQCTADHLIATTLGWKRAADLLPSSGVDGHALTTVTVAQRLTGIPVDVLGCEGVPPLAVGLGGVPVVESVVGGITKLEMAGEDAVVASTHEVINLQSSGIVSEEAHHSSVNQSFAVCLAVDPAVSIRAGAALPDQAVSVLDRPLEQCFEPVPVVRCSHSATVPVFDLEIDGPPEFVANGIVVHNCRRISFFENSVLVEEPADPSAFAWVDSIGPGTAVRSIGMTAKTASKQIVYNNEKIRYELIEDGKCVRFSKSLDALKIKFPGAEVVPKTAAIGPSRQDPATRRRLQERWLRDHPEEETSMCPASGRTFVKLQDDGKIWCTTCGAHLDPIDGGTPDDPYPADYGDMPIHEKGISTTAKTAAVHMAGRWSRGFPCDIGSANLGRAAIALYRRLENKTATAADIMSVASEKGNVGGQWAWEDGGEPDYEGWSDPNGNAEDYAWQEDLARQWIEHNFDHPPSDDELWTEMEDNLGGISVIITATGDGTYANPSWDARVTPGARFKIDTIRYDAGWGWTTLNGGGITVTTSKTAGTRDRVNALPESYDNAIQSAMVNAYDLGLREDADDDGEAFWGEVLGQVTASKKTAACNVLVDDMDVFGHITRQRPGILLQQRDGMSLVMFADNEQRMFPTSTVVNAGPFWNGVGTVIASKTAAAPKVEIREYPDYNTGYMTYDAVIRTADSVADVVGNIPSEINVRVAERRTKVWSVRLVFGPYNDRDASGSYSSGKDLGTFEGTRGEAKALATREVKKAYAEWMTGGQQRMAKTADKAPYYVRQRGDSYVVVNDDGDVKGTHDTREEALAQQRAMYANIPDAAEKAEEKHEGSKTAARVKADWYEAQYRSRRGYWSAIGGPCKTPEQAQKRADDWTKKNPTYPARVSKIDGQWGGEGTEHIAFGETRAPSQVNTLGNAECAVCGAEGSFDSTGRCTVCSYLPTPEPFRAPKLDVAQNVDMRDGWVNPDLMSAPSFVSPEEQGASDPATPNPNPEPGGTVTASRNPVSNRMSPPEGVESSLEGVSMRPSQQVTAANAQSIEDLRRENASLRRKLADVANPGQPVPEPAAQAPVLTDGVDDVPFNGEGGSGEMPALTGTEPDATTSVTESGTTLPAVAPDATTDVEAPVAGANVEGDDYVVDTAPKAGTPTETAPAFSGDNSWVQGSKQSADEIQARTYATMRLARLRLQAGIEQDDDITVAQKIARSKMSMDTIRHEIQTLTAVASARPQQTAARRTTQRGIPTLASQSPPMLGSIPSMEPSDDEFLFT